MEVNGKPKVVQLSSVHSSFDTRIYHKICKSLVRNGYKVDLIIQDQEDEVRDGINIVALPIANKKSDRIFKIIPRLFKKSIHYPYGTIFHFHDPELIPLGFVLKLFGYKVIYDVHEDVPEAIKSKKWIPKLIRRIIPSFVKIIEGLAKKSFDGIIVVTHAIENRLASDQTYLIQNFPILHSIETVESSKNWKEKNSVFYLGDITLIRGLKEDIKAIELANQKEDIHFILAGKFLPKELEHELKTERGWNYVDFVGWIDRKKFNEYTSQSFSGLVTFHPEPNHIDAQPNKLFEYMHAGLPVIAS
ncbi:MAG: glycosyltransferase, partial [Candidatus Paceibacterota bacterium]